MSGWMLFLVIAFVLGIIVSNILLLKHSSKMKLPDSVLKAIEEKKIEEKKQAELLAEQKQKTKKPTDD